MSLCGATVCRCSTRFGVSAGSLRKPACVRRLSVLETANAQPPRPQASPSPITAIKRIDRIWPPPRPDTSTVEEECALSPIVETYPDDLTIIVDSRCARQDPPGVVRQQAIEIGGAIAL